MSSVLWCVMKGRAVAPPAMAWSMGVSTSRKPRAMRKRRMSPTIAERQRKRAALSALASRST
jgi:hypothetical protein